jgi:predicted MFS family arabinose efflux permease
MAAGVGASGFLLLGHVSAAPLLALCAAMGSAGFYGMRVMMSTATLGVVERSGRGSAAFARYRLWASMGYTLTASGGGLLLSRTSFAVVFSFGALLFGAAVLCGLAVDYTASGHERPLDASEEAPPPVISGRRVLVTLALMALLFGTITSSADTYVSLLMRSLHGSLAQVGLTATIPALVEIPLMALAGSLADRLPRAPLLALGMAVLPLRFTLYALVQAPLPLLGIQMLDGFTFTVYAIIGVAVLAGETPREERAWSLGLYSSAATIGPIVGPLLAGLLASRVGLHTMFGTFAVAAVIVPTVVTIGLWPLMKRSAVSHQPSV